MNRSDYTHTIHGNAARRRTCINTSKGEITAFYVQLEVNENPFSNDQAWTDIAWFDHNPESGIGHDIELEGLHMDIHHPTFPDRKVKDFPSVPLNEAPRFCEKYFDENYVGICERYARWADCEELLRLTAPLER